VPTLTSPAAALPSLPCYAMVRDHLLGDHLALLHHAGSVETLPSATQKDCNTRTSLLLHRDLAGPRRPTCSGKPIPAASRHVAWPFPPSCPDFIHGIQAGPPRRAFPILGKSWCPVAASLWGGQVTLLCVGKAQLHCGLNSSVLVSLQTIFPTNQLKSCLLQQLLRSLVVGGRRTRPQLRLLRRGTDSRRGQTPFRAASHRHQPPALSSEVMLPGGGKSRVPQPCWRGMLLAASPRENTEHQHFAPCAGAQIFSHSQGRGKPLCSEK